MSTAPPRAYHPNLITAVVCAATAMVLTRMWVGVLNEAVPTMGLAVAALSVGAVGGIVWPTVRGWQIRSAGRYRGAVPLPAPEPPHDRASLRWLVLDALWMSVWTGGVFFAMELVLWALGASPQPVHFEDEHVGTGERVRGAFLVACAFPTGAVIGCVAVQNVVHTRWRRARARVPKPGED